MAERSTDNREVEGSIPSPATIREIAMLLFIKNLIKDAWILYPTQIIAGLAIVVILIVLLLSGCHPMRRVEAPAIEGPGYCDWQAAPSWVARDFVEDPAGFGLMDGHKFMGKHGLPCYALKIDSPPADGSCDIVVLVCETGQTDDRHGPGTPLVRLIGRGLMCDRWDGLINTIKKDEANKSL